MIQEGIPPRNPREGIPTSIEYRSYRKDSHTSFESKRRRQLIAEEIIGDESHISFERGSNSREH
jgi:hypothetical protein